MNVPSALVWLLLGVALDKMPMIIPNLVELSLLVLALLFKVVIPDTIRLAEGAVPLEGDAAAAADAAAVEKPKAE